MKQNTEYKEICAKRNYPVTQHLPQGWNWTPSNCINAKSCKRLRYQPAIEMSNENNQRRQWIVR